MDKIIKDALQTDTFNPTGYRGGGCINEGECYETDNGKIFVKKNKKPGAKVMFNGEMASLNAILTTKTIRAPKPIAVLDNPKGGAVLVMEYLDINSVSNWTSLGEKLAEMHLDNKRRQEKADQLSSTITANTSTNNFVTEYGFDTTTCCGYLPLENTWTNDWVTFFARHRIDPQIRMAAEKYHSNEASELWNRLQRVLPTYFENISIFPSLLHGDLWSGNIGEVNGEPIIFDPGSFYGHYEFEMGIMKMFGGFNRKFFDAYHKILPKEKGLDDRLQLYQLFHYLNHWNHFGGSYKSSAFAIMHNMFK